MRTVFIAAIFLNVALGSWIDDEYWTSITSGGKPDGGRSVVDFVTPVDLGDPSAQGYIAYWMTRDKYDRHRHYEAFGHAFIDDEGRICARFVGYHDEPVLLCEGFRVLSRHHRTNEQPFQWVRGGEANEANTIGYRTHRVAKVNHNGKTLYGDVRIAIREYKAITDTQQFVIISQPKVFDTEVYVLAKTTPDEPPRNYHRPSRIHVRLPVEQPRPAALDAVRLPAPAVPATKFIRRIRRIKPLYYVVVKPQPVVREQPQHFVFY